MSGRPRHDAMALNPADIATVSKLLDEALELPAPAREAWLAALPPEHQRHAPALRGMLGQQSQLNTEGPLSTLPLLGRDDTEARGGDACCSSSSACSTCACHKSELARACRTPGTRDRSGCGRCPDRVVECV